MAMAVGKTRTWLEHHLSSHELSTQATAYLKRQGKQLPSMTGKCCQKAECCNLLRDKQFQDCSLQTTSMNNVLTTIYRVVIGAVVIGRVMEHPSYPTTEYAHTTPSYKCIRSKCLEMLKHAINTPAPLHTNQGFKCGRLQLNARGFQAPSPSAWPC